MNAPRIATHDIFNQSPPMGDTNLFDDDPALAAAVVARGGHAAGASLSDFGRRWGLTAMAELGRQANEVPPRLKSHDARGQRQNLVEFHPAYHELMAASVADGLHASVWAEDGTPRGSGAHVERAARLFMAGQVEAGHLCPIVMTNASVAALQADPPVLKRLIGRIRSTAYDPRPLPANDKLGLTLGMGMTEKQGGTDVRANTTWAEPDGDLYRLTGHKWFLSAPMSDVFLVLAQAAGGLTAFLVPRLADVGRPNGFTIPRLKDKLGNRSNASAEVEFNGAYAERIGEEGAGIRTMLRMVQLTRLDCAVASAALLRAALADAIHHLRHRAVFGRKLADQPAMRSVVADLALDREAATALAFRLAHAFDRAGEDEREAAFARLVTPAAKYWICKSAPAFVYEAMECLGGNGYVEDGRAARLYREAPVNAIWEGSGNVVALDALRAATREPDATASVIATVAGAVRDLPGAKESVEALVGAFEAGEPAARGAAERLAVLAAAAALAETAPAEIATAFAEARLRPDVGRTYGAGRAGGAALFDALAARTLAAG